MITAKRSATPIHSKQPPLTWLPLMTEYGKSASFVCSNGHYGVLFDHEIAADGIVTPSVVCSAEGCSFHEMVKLERWE